MKPTKIVMIALLLLILYQVTFGASRRSYMRDLDTVQCAAASKGPKSIFDLKNSLGCQPSGYNPDSAYYTKSLTPGGLCGDEDYVRNYQRDYTIEGGVGGSLLAK